MDEKDQELRNTEADSSVNDAEIKEKAAQKFSGEKEYRTTELNDELERLAQTFRDEMKKAQEAQGEECFDEENEIAEEDICECCGENLKDKSYGEDYPYCSDCRDAMTRYPISWYNVVITVALIVLSFVSFSSFLGDFDGFYHTYKAREARADNKLATAVAEYDSAIEIFDNNDVNAKKLRLEEADVLYRTLPYGVSSMDKINDLVTDALSDAESNMPIYKGYTDLRDEVMTLYGTMKEFYVVVNNTEYADYTNDAVYEAAMTEIGKILDKEIEVKSIDGEKTNSYPADEAIVRFCQFMFAYTAGKQEDSYKYMREVYDIKPDYLWLYAYELGVVDAQTGAYDEAKLLADALYNNNKEDYGAYCVYSMTERLCGNFEKAIEWADKGIEMVPANTEIMRNKAMACAANGDLETAKAVLEDAIYLEENALLSVTLLAVEQELGNTDSVEEITAYLEEQGVEIPARASAYLKGEISIKKLFSEGTGDIE